MNAMLHIMVKAISIAAAAAAATSVGGVVVHSHPLLLFLEYSISPSSSSTRTSTALIRSSHYHRLIRHHPDPELRSSTRTCTKLYASPLIQTNVIERLELTKQFERWRFMQRLLEGEILPSDIEDVLLLVLQAYLQHGPTGLSSNNQNENGGIASPVLTPDQKFAVQDVIDSMISISDGIGDSRILHMLVSPPADWISASIDGEGGLSSKEDTVVEVDSNALSILQKIELVLPDPDEDEESHKGAWDVIVELHGRESVRVEEEKLQRENSLNVESTASGIRVKYRVQSLQWRTLSTIGRVLIHFDFLTKGVLKEGTFSVD